MLGVTKMEHLAAISAVIVSLLPIPPSFADDEWVSLINLIATPEKYHNKKVVFTAYVTIEFENMSLCLTEHTLSSKDCLWHDIESPLAGSEKDVSRYKAIEATWRQINHQIVTVHGIFDKDDAGHLGRWSGAVENVTSVNAKGIYIDFASNPPLVRIHKPGGQIQ
jgi:hypothetical protein